jgi:hypothetical protein
MSLGTRKEYMQQKTKEIFASRATTLWSRLMPTCPPPTTEYLMRWREQGKYPLLEAIEVTSRKWDRGELASPLNAWQFCGALCRNIALSRRKAILGGAL